MDTNALFTMALQLNGTPWLVKKSELSGEPKILQLELGFERGSRFACPECGEHCSVHATDERRWRHLNFFQYRCELTAPVPRINCADHGVRNIDVPWAQRGSGFTSMMEAMMALLSPQTTSSEVVETLDEHDTLIWRWIPRLVDEGRLSFF